MEKIKNYNCCGKVAELMLAAYTDLPLAQKILKVCENTLLPRAMF